MRTMHRDLFRLAVQGATIVRGISESRRKKQKGGSDSNSKCVQRHDTYVPLCEKMSSFSDLDIS